jgi:hypothetical protein
MSFIVISLLSVGNLLQYIMFVKNYNLDQEQPLNPTAVLRENWGPAT